MTETFEMRRVGWILIAGSVLASSSPVAASPEGEAAAALVREASYRHYLDDLLLTHRGHDRGVFTAHHDLARDNIYEVFDAFDLTVALDPFLLDADWDGEDEILYNVVATKFGSIDPSIEYIVGAHYDSAENPGADDNASGVALILEAARILSVFDSDYTIRFIAFDAEEWWFDGGSTAYAQAHVSDDIRGMISADMVAYTNGGPIVADIFGRPQSDALKSAVAEAVDTYGDGLTTNIGGQDDGSNHASFEDAGFAACLLIETGGGYQNPYFHRAEDSVDTPDYIDYAYASKMTRSVVGFLTDAAGVHVYLPDADYDGDGDVDQDDFDAFTTCHSVSGIEAESDCVFFDFDGDGDVDCIDFGLLAAVWTGGGEAPPYWPCVGPVPAAAEGLPRSLTVTAREHGLPMALLVTAESADPHVACLHGYVQTDGRLGETPVFQTYDAWGTVEVRDEAVIGGCSYSVWCDFGEPGSPWLSTPAPAVTPPWGDVVGDFVEGAWTPPNGAIDFNDIAAMVDTFRALPTALPVRRADLVGGGTNVCRPNGVIDFDDISSAVDGFRGISYWVSTSCPALCP